MMTSWYRALVGKGRSWLGVLVARGARIGAIVAGTSVIGAIVAGTSVIGAIVAGTSVVKWLQRRDYVSILQMVLGQMRMTGIIYKVSFYITLHDVSSVFYNL